MTETELKFALDQAVADGSLLSDSRANLLEMLVSSKDSVVRASILELVGGGHWTELNDRFFRKLAFGTGGLRGRSIGVLVTQAEQGKGGPNGRPEFPCTGTNAMNAYNVSRATQGLVKYLQGYFGDEGRPKLVLSYDTRHFSADFAELAARVASENGCDVVLFDGPRATPEMSFAVRYLSASAGVQITASHNPAHDNGYKVNFADGGQIIDPQATLIITEVNAIVSDSYEVLPEAACGKIERVGREIDEAYMARLVTLLQQPEVVAKADGLKIVFTALHGAGEVLAPKLLRELGFQVTTVPEQDVPDGRFPTVASPNPENGPALKMGMDLADKIGAAVVIGTDPDCDRMGVAVRDAAGKMTLLSGNQIGCLIAWYRTKTFFEQGFLHEGNRSNALLIKTFVTTDLYKAIAERFGIGCLETLTGFKYMAAKLKKYEEALSEEQRLVYRVTPDAQTAGWRLGGSKFFVSGGEESYGYLATDFVRDKDGNAAALLFSEVAAYAVTQNVTLTQLLDRIYCETAYFLERNFSKEFPGATGAAKIKGLASSYAASPPVVLDGSSVVEVKDFSHGGHFDAEGDSIPREDMLIFRLEDGRRVAVRPSGTEPKIKYYLFARADTVGLQPDELVQLKEAAAVSLGRLWDELEMDIQTRLGV